MYVCMCVRTYVLCIFIYVYVPYLTYEVIHEAPYVWSPWYYTVASQVSRLHPLDFYLRGYLKAMVYQVEVQNMDHAKERIRDACTPLTPNVLSEFAMSGRDASVCSVNVMVST